MGQLADRHGSAKHPGRAVAHPRPESMSDETVQALGKLSAALETVYEAEMKGREQRSKGGAR